MADAMVHVNSKRVENNKKGGMKEKKDLFNKF